jgi:predicted nucleotidyltransferase
MRLLPHQIEAIRAITAEVGGDQARVLLFGSRTRDDLRGGDIDLLIELPQPGADRLDIALRVHARLQRVLGQRKIDVLVADPTSEPSPVLNAARRDGQLL